MKLIIDIPEDNYKRLMEYDGMIDDFWLEAIANGTPLPKGHGRLIDADTLWDAYHSNDYDFYEALDDAPTIIGADKTEGE